LLRRERRPIAALAAALLLFHSLVMAIGLAAPAAAATGADALFVICAPGSDGSSGDGQDQGDAPQHNHPCALCQPQAQPATPLDVPRPRRRPPVRARRRPVHAAAPPCVNGHLRPPNRAPPASPRLP